MIWLSEPVLNITKKHWLNTMPMDFTGKPMKGFIYVGYDGCKTEKTLSGWIDAGLRYISTLAKAN